ncbi:MAG: isoamylase early set domain-containing protein [Candidatus Krumholzibacteriota bacterium]|nr:isoamylase early set domain-containing protein [Candidatus Krumholzibacteriota bacterium]
MRSAASKYLIVTAIVTILFAAAGPSAARSFATSDTAAEVAIRQQIISFLQTGGRISDLPPSHILHPLTKAPLTAITSYIVMKEDSSMMERFFPVIRNISLDNFRDEMLTRQKLIKGSNIETGKESIALSPSVNSLAAIELHALSLIASGAGKYEEAIELHLWAKQLSSLTENTFFDYSMNAFFPISTSGKYIIAFTPEFLLPMVNDRILGSKRRTNVADRLMYNIDSGQGILCARGTMWNDPELRPLVFDMLSNINDLSQERLKDFHERSENRNTSMSPQTENDWTRFWMKPGRTSALFSASTTVSSLANLSSILQRESVLKESAAEGLFEDIRILLSSLDAQQTDLDGHISSIGLINRIMVKIGNISSVLESGERLWTILDEIKWNSISPRTRKLIAVACTDSKEELIDAKVVLSSLMMKCTGIEGSADLPEKAVRIGDPLPIEISIRSTQTPLEISRLYFQISGSRWMLSDENNASTIGRDPEENKWKRSLVLPPSSRPGVITLPMFLDFMHNGKRTEIHMVESVTLTRRYDLALEFPKGRRLSDDESVPLNILIRYKPEQRLQGSVDGVFLENMTCAPELPSRFMIEPETEVTTLPLDLSLTGVLSPGRYPFALSVQLDGQRIALFEEELLKPIAWLHLGPVKNSRWALEEAVELQGDIYSPYISPDGRTLRWTNVPPGAIDSRGAVLPDRLYGSGSESAMLLYSVFELKTIKKVIWTITSSNITSFWINSVEILSGSNSSTSYSGTTTLKKGRNTILISSFWNDSPSPVLLSLSDEAGLPVPELENKIYNISSGLAERNSGRPAETLNANDTHLRKITLQLEYPGAKEVSVISDFNNWAPGATPMNRTSSGNWQTVLELPRGRYHYLFIIDKKLKITDPSNENREPDGFGGDNSILIVK